MSPSYRPRAQRDYCLKDNKRKERITFTERKKHTPKEIDRAERWELKRKQLRVCQGECQKNCILEIFTMGFQIKNPMSNALSQRKRFFQRKKMGAKLLGGQLFLKPMHWLWYSLHHDCITFCSKLRLCSTSQKRSFWGSRSNWVGISDRKNLNGLEWKTQRLLVCLPRGMLLSVDVLLGPCFNLASVVLNHQVAHQPCSLSCSCNLITFPGARAGQRGTDREITWGGGREGFTGNDMAGVGIVLQYVACSCSVNTEWGKWRHGGSRPLVWLPPDPINHVYSLTVK